MVDLDVPNQERFLISKILLIIVNNKGAEILQTSLRSYLIHYSFITKDNYFRQSEIEMWASRSPIHISLGEVRSNVYVKQFLIVLKSANDQVYRDKNVPKKFIFEKALRIIGEKRDRGEDYSWIILAHLSFKKLIEYT